MRVFIGGSLGISALPNLAISRIDEAISQGAAFLVGDAPGVDALMQAYVQDRGVQSVQVFHSVPQGPLSIRASSACPQHYTARRIGRWPGSVIRR